MDPIPRIELPSLLAQSQHVARLGGARPDHTERVERQEAHDVLVRLSEQRTQEVQEAERVQATKDHGEQPRRDRDGRRRNLHEQHGPEPGDDDYHLVDMTA
jgi:hypothetical protein